MNHTLVKRLCNSEFRSVQKYPILTDQKYEITHLSKISSGNRAANMDSVMQLLQTVVQILGVNKMIMLTLSELHPHSAFLQRMYLEVLKNFLIFIQKVEKRPFSQIFT